MSDNNVMLDLSVKRKLQYKIKSLLLIPMHIVQVPLLLAIEIVSYSPDRAFLSENNTEHLKLARRGISQRGTRQEYFAPLKRNVL